MEGRDEVKERIVSTSESDRQKEPDFKIEAASNEGRPDQEELARRRRWCLGGLMD